MATKKSSSTEKIDIVRDVGHIQSGRSALHELARSHESGISGATLSICVEQMSLEMQVKAQHILDILDYAEVAHGD